MDSIKPITDMEGVCRTIVQRLQKERSLYLLFGCYWWAVKRILKKHGYDKAQLSLLGTYVDEEDLKHLPASTDAYLLALALKEQQERSFADYGSADCYYPDDGEPFTLVDDDAN